MREVGRALALDPANVDALRTLVRLMAEPPRLVPGEVMEKLESSTVTAMSELLPYGTIAYASFLFYAPLVLWMGLKDWSLGVASGILIVVAAAFVASARRAGREAPRRLYPALAASTVVIMLAATMFGPFIFVPAIAALNTLFYVMQLPRERVPTAIAIGCLPVALPAFLQVLGIARSSYRFVGGTMEVLPWMHSFGHPAAPVFLFVTSVAPIVLACVLARRLRESLAQAELKSQLQAWQLSKLLPVDSASAGPTRDPSLTCTRGAHRHVS
jgi:serine/threonine-protein kinase